MIFLELPGWLERITGDIEPVELYFAEQGTDVKLIAQRIDDTVRLGLEHGRESSQAFAAFPEQLGIVKLAEFLAAWQGLAEVLLDEFTMLEPDLLKNASLADYRQHLHSVQPDQTVFDPLQLPQIAAWRAEFDNAPDLLDFLGEKGSVTLAVAFTELFWPRFVEERGCVLRAVMYEGVDAEKNHQRFEEWWHKLHGDRPSIESVLNHLHLWDVFDSEAEDVPPEAMRRLAKVLAKTWRAALAEQFPGRQFVVSADDNANDYGPTLRVYSSS